MIKFNRIVGMSLPAAACLFLTAGCQPDAVFPLNSTEGQVLNAMLTEGRAVKVDVPEGLPVAFDPVSIDRMDDWFYGHWISGRLTWKWTVPLDQREATLRRLAKEPIPDGATIAVVWVKLEHLDANGKTCAEDTIPIAPTQNAHRLKLYNFGRGGDPVRIRATVLRVEVANPVPAIPPAAEEPARTPAPAAEPDTDD